METNTLPRYDLTDAPTGCCPRFDPTGWDGEELHFRNKPFVRATTRSAMHIPLDMGRVFARVHSHIEAADAYGTDNIIVLSRDVSPWMGEHLFAVSRPVPEEEMTTLSGDFITRVFEGPYREAKQWEVEMQNDVRARGKEPGRVYFFYTTCPKCAAAYGKNYVVGVAEI